MVFVFSVFVPFDVNRPNLRLVGELETSFLKKKLIVKSTNLSESVYPFIFLLKSLLCFNIGFKRIEIRI